LNLLLADGNDIDLKGIKLRNRKENLVSGYFRFKRYVVDEEPKREPKREEKEIGLHQGSSASL
jgi:hypothetical protein